MNEKIKFDVLISMLKKGFINYRNQSLFKFDKQFWVGLAISILFSTILYWLYIYLGELLKYISRSPVPHHQVKEFVPIYKFIYNYFFAFFFNLIAFNILIIFLLQQRKKDYKKKFILLHSITGITFFSILIFYFIIDLFFDFTIIVRGLRSGLGYFESSFFIATFSLILLTYFGNTITFLRRNFSKNFWKQILISSIVLVVFSFILAFSSKDFGKILREKTSSPEANYNYKYFESTESNIMEYKSFSDYLYVIKPDESDERIYSCGSDIKTTDLSEIIGCYNYNIVYGEKKLSKNKLKEESSK